MPTFIALLRGVNVGRNILKMDRLRAVCSELGAENVRTYVQSGNVVFTARGTASRWAENLQKRLAGECRLPPSVMVRTAAEMDAVFHGNPFLKEEGVDTARLAVTFLRETPSKAALAAMRALDLGRERFHVAGREVYIHSPDGFADSQLYVLVKVISQPATVRNWNTVTKLCEMART